VGADAVTWFKVDDKLHDHRKARQAGLEALALWTLAGSWCADNLTDGFVPSDILTRWTKKSVSLAHRLVDVGMWDEDTEKGEVGYRFHDWKRYQPTRSEVEQIRSKRAAAGQAGGLASARAKAQANAEANVQQTSNDPATPSRPVPSRSGLGSQSTTATRTADQSDRLDIDKIATILGSDRAWAVRVSADIIDRAPSPPRDPQRYVEAAIRERPADYRPTPGPPPIARLCDHGRDRLTCVDCEDQP
jgi:hypothetical protein